VATAAATTKPKDGDKKLVAVNKYMAAALGKYVAMPMKPGFEYPQPPFERRCCVEDQTTASREPARDPYLVACTLYKKEKVDKKLSWRAEFERGQPAADYQFPRSTIDWGRRLRSKELTFRVVGDAKTPIEQLYSTVGYHDLRALLLECVETECEHAIVPLRIRLTEHVCQNITTPFKIQIGTTPFQMTLERNPFTHTKSKSVQHWLDDSGTGIDVTHMTASAVSSVTPRKCVIQSSAAQPSLVKSSVLFAAGVEYAIPNNYDILRDLSARRNKGYGWNYHLIRTSQIPSTDVLVRQADVENKCHDVVSYVVQSEVYAVEKGFNATKLSQMTLWQDDDADRPVSQRKSYWKVNAASLRDRMQTHIDRILSYRLVMDITDGMTATFVPVDTALYAPKGEFMVSFTVIVDYIVIDL